MAFSLSRTHICPALGYRARVAPNRSSSQTWLAAASSQLSKRMSRPAQLGQRAVWLDILDRSRFHWRWPCPADPALGRALRVIERSSVPVALLTRMHGQGAHRKRLLHARANQIGQRPINQTPATHCDRASCVGGLIFRRCTTSFSGTLGFSACSARWSSTSTRAPKQARGGGVAIAGCCFLHCDLLCFHAQNKRIQAGVRAKAASAAWRRFKPPMIVTAILAKTDRTISGTHARRRCGCRRPHHLPGRQARVEASIMAVMRGTSSTDLAGPISSTILPAFLISMPVAEQPSRA